VKVAVRDYTKIPRERLFEFSKKLHIVEFTVEMEQNEEKGSNNDGGNDDGNDGGDDGKGGMDEEANDLYDTDTEKEPNHDNPPNSNSNLKTPSQKSSSSQGSKTVNMVMDQDQQLRMLMESNNPKLSTAGMKTVAGGQKGTDASLNPGVSITKDNSNWKEPELYSPSKGCGMVVASDTCGETSDKGCGWDTQGDTDLWKTPEQVKSVLSDCPIGVNKFYNLIEEESNHSKWVEFRKLAQKDSATEECSNLLKRMELKVSEDEEEIVAEEEEEEVLSLEESGILPKNIEEIEDKFSGGGQEKPEEEDWLGAYSKGSPTQESP
jgi:hypothetical protein